MNNFKIGEKLTKIPLIQGGMGVYRRTKYILSFLNHQICTEFQPA